jgi:AcrR family transcriptional regulator
MAGLTEALARRALERTVAGRQAEYAEEVQRIVDATYRLIERTGSVDPPLRDVLTEAGLSTQSFYRFFTSKDELMLALLDDGRRRLVDYLRRRMDAAKSPTAKVRAWIEGVLAQASQDSAAARTRPFVANQDRLAEAFPAEQQETVDLLIDLLAQPVAQLQRTRESGSPTARLEPRARRDAEAVYELTFGTMHKHLVRRTRPTPEEVEHVVRFALRGLGVPAGRARV